jgi:hypothetical protein
VRRTGAGAGAATVGGAAGTSGDAVEGPASAGFDGPGDATGGVRSEGAVGAVMSADGDAAPGVDDAADGTVAAD